MWVNCSLEKVAFQNQTRYFVSIRKTKCKFFFVRCARLGGGRCEIPTGKLEIAKRRAHLKPSVDLFFLSLVSNCASCKRESFEFLFLLKFFLLKSCLKPFEKHPKGSCWTIRTISRKRQSHFLAVQCWLTIKSSRKSLFSPTTNCPKRSSISAAKRRRKPSMTYEWFVSVSAKKWQDCKSRWSSFKKQNKCHTSDSHVVVVVVFHPLVPFQERPFLTLTVASFFCFKHYRFDPCMLT